MSKPEPGGGPGGIDRRSLIGAALTALIAPAITAEAAAQSVDGEIVIVDGWLLSPRDLAGPARVDAAVG